MLERIAALTLAALLVGPGVAAAQNTAITPDKADPDLWDGLFTPAQVDRGRKTFMSHCTFCHGDDLNGGEAPPLRGGHFGRSWSGHYLDRLFTRIKENMPPDQPAELTDEEKLDVLTFLLYSNGFPTGDRELKLDLDVMSFIHIVGKNGLEPPTSGALVGAVGCLERAADGAFVLTRSPEAFVTSLEDTRPAEARFVASAPAGTQQFRLMDAFPKPDDKIGHKVLVKGFLIRADDGNKINVITLGEVASTCGS